jgi:putative transposase
MNTAKKAQERKLQSHLPSLEKIQQELGTAQSIDDFFGKEGIFARLFAKTLETMLEAELTEQLGYERYEAKGRNSGNSRNGKRPKQLRTSAGDTTIQLPRDRNGEFSSKLLAKHQTSTNELEEKILAMYGKGMSTRDIQHMLAETYGVEISADTISAITDKVWPLVEAWQNRPLAAIYPIIYLDALHLKLRRQGRVENVAVYIVLGVDLEGHRDVLGHWLGDGAEGANFWLSVVTDLQARGWRIFSSPASMG